MRYDEDAVEYVLQRVRFMHRFFDDVVDEDPRTRKFLPELFGAYMDMLNDDLAPYAFDLAEAVIEWEDRSERTRKRLRAFRSIRPKRRRG